MAAVWRVALFNQRPEERAMAASEETTERACLRPARGLPHAILYSRNECQSGSLRIRFADPESRQSCPWFQEWVKPGARALRVRRVSPAKWNRAC